MVENNNQKSNKTVKKVRFTQREINKAVQELSKEVNKKATKRLFIQLINQK